MRSPLVILAALTLAGCGASTTPPPSTSVPDLPALVAQSRPVGVGPRFAPPAPQAPAPGCAPRIGRRSDAHVELFGAGRVVLFAAGIGTRGPRRFRDGRLVAASCYGPLVTLDPTGLVLVAARARATLGALFDAWRQPLTGRRAASFRGPVSVFVDGRRRAGDPRTTPLDRHAEIVIESGPPVPPHRSYTFPPGS